MDILSIQTQVRFRVQTPLGDYVDAIYLSPENPIDVPALELLAETRAEAWLRALTNTPALGPLPFEELVVRLEAQEADVQETQEKLILAIATQSDTEAPTVPQGLRATATARGIQLAWEPSRDDVAFGGYGVFRDGEPIAKTPKERYTDFDPPRDVLLTYYVTAYDQAENVSERSVAVQLMFEEGATVESKDTGRVPPKRAELVPRAGSAPRRSP